jgi:phosphoribosylformylglycinamidine synthase
MEPDRVNVLVLTGFGTNCERETAYAAGTAGADAVRVAHFADVIQERVLIGDYQLLVFPGGFLDGDHLGAAQAAAVRFTYARTRNGSSVLDSIHDTLARGCLILGICNGFQLLVKLGLLPALHGSYRERRVSLSYNDSARFEDRWCRLTVNRDSPCVFTRGLDRMYLPVRHGEGKLIPQDERTLSEMREKGLIVLQYADASWRATQTYPDNPNGSPLAIAGLTDPSGQILGLMPHPEAFNHPTNHPAWTRDGTDPLGTSLFANAIEHLRNRKP